MEKELSLLVVDVSAGWEEEAKAGIRGYRVGFDRQLGRYVRRREKLDRSLRYPHGPLRAGFDVITDTVRLAKRFGITTYAVEYGDNWEDGRDVSSYPLQALIPKRNRFRKFELDGFTSGRFARRLERDGCQHLMIIGYDRDWCVLETARGAIARGLTVVTSEHAMLTRNYQDLRQKSLQYFRDNTVFLTSVADVWNYLFDHRR